MIDTSSFRRLLGRFASGIAIITARDCDRDVGMTVSAFCSASLSPPLVLVCVDSKASMHDLLLRHPKLGISIIGSEHEAHSRRFADKNEARRFDGVPFTRGESSVMLLDDATAQLECQLVSHHRAGDHTIFIAEVERGLMGDAEPLLHFGGRYAQLATTAAVS
ncbi:MAG TPA: flavin reductase family protein [Gemmatimonadaceae bacterium]|jgi:flavin reductase (DIM6/NTAB) family NADH-FMN oxidoreductase RutF